jgi:acyl-ACP thioesterase
MKNFDFLSHFIVDSDTDFNQKLKISKVFSLMQDAASLHAEKLGVHRETILSENNFVWILMRVFLKVERWPGLYEKIEIETWPLKPRLRYERDFIFRDEKGEIIMRASSVWVVIDIEKRKITKENIMAKCNLDYRKDRAAEEGKLFNIKLPKEMQKKDERIIRPSDIDLNLHVNNANYPDLVLDALGLSFQQKNEITAFEIDYMKEIKEGDNVEVFQGEEDNAYLFEGRANGEQSFKVRFEYQPR